MLKNSIWISFELDKGYVEFFATLPSVNIVILPWSCPEPKGAPDLSGSSQYA